MARNMGIKFVVELHFILLIGFRVDLFYKTS
jgi:hypothetical protein